MYYLYCFLNPYLNPYRILTLPAARVSLPLLLLHSDRVYSKPKSLKPIASPSLALRFQHTLLPTSQLTLLLTLLRTSSPCLALRHQPNDPLYYPLHSQLTLLLTLLLTSASPCRALRHERNEAKPQCRRTRGAGDRGCRRRRRPGGSR